MAIKY